MTRLLAQLLEAAEPSFRTGIDHLEHLNGAPNTDIRLSSAVQQATQTKLRQLGLDPHDTTGPELYAVLKQRLLTDEARFKAALQQTAHDIEDPVALVARAVKGLGLGKDCLALKPTVAKRLLKSQLPKRTMKALGYRSVDSMLKHEPVSLLFTAAWLTENKVWLQRFIASYRKLQPSDFELRDITIEQPTAKRWQNFSATVVARHKQYIFSFKELSAIVLLPLPEERPAMTTLSTAVLTLHACNELITASTYLKLQQVRVNFGSLVEQLVTTDPTINSAILQSAIPWQVVQRYYARHKDRLRSEVFEPHVQTDDLVWHPVEALLTKLEPSLEYWQGTAHLGMLHEGKPVSCNLTDALLSHCNALPFASRISTYFQRSLWHELLLQYFDHQRVEEAVVAQLQPAMATETT